MRDIKFRGLTTKGEMVEGSLVTTNAFIKHKPKQHTKHWIVTSAFGNGGWFNVRCRTYVKPETVGQFTGLQDINGVDIYEGDILKFKADYLSIVKWNKVRMRFELSVNKSSFYDYGIIRRGSVVGNIHENPELIK